jgi:hypothetical protein
MCSAILHVLAPLKCTGTEGAHNRLNGRKWPDQSPRKERTAVQQLGEPAVLYAGASSIPKYATWVGTATGRRLISAQRKREERIFTMMNNRPVAPVLHDACALESLFYLYAFLVIHNVCCTFCFLIPTASLSSSRVYPCRVLVVNFVVEMPQVLHPRPYNAPSSLSFEMRPSTSSTFPPPLRGGGSKKS